MTKGLKNIAIICDYTIFPERLGGMDRFFVAYDAALKSQGYQLTWFFKEVQLFDFYKSLIIKNAENSNIELFFLNYLNENDVEFDVIITHFLTQVSFFYKKVKKKLPSTKIINIDHNPRPVGGFQLKKQIKNIIKGKLYSKYIDQFIAVSEYSKTHLIKDYGTQISNKIKIIFNGVEVLNYKKKIDFESHSNFIIACHLRKEKGVQDVISAVQKIPENTRESLRIDIYGTGPYESFLKTFVKGKSLDKIITFKGSTIDLPNIYYNYDYLLHPSHGETFCFTVVESLVSNLPVITTQEEGNILNLVVNGKNGFLHKSKDIASIKSIISEILLKEKTIKNGVYFKKVENEFSIEKMVENHLKLIKR